MARTDEENIQGASPRIRVKGMVQMVRAWAISLETLVSVFPEERHGGALWELVLYLQYHLIHLFSKATETWNLYWSVKNPAVPG